LEQQTEETKEPKAPVWLSVISLAGGAVQGVCAILVASSSLKVLVSVAAFAGIMQTSKFHAPIVRLPLMFLSAVLALVTLYVLWNGHRLRNLKTAQWRKRKLSTKEKVSIGFSLIVSLITLLLVISEAILHPIFEGL